MKSKLIFLLVFLSSIAFVLGGSLNLNPEWIDSDMDQNITVYGNLTNSTGDLVVNNSIAIWFNGSRINNWYESDGTYISWWNSSWNYRAPISLSLSSGATPKNYTHYFDLNTSDLGSNFNWSRSCAEVRFVNSSNSEMNFWLENCNSTNVKAWVKFENNITSSGETIYLYYGNFEANNASNGDNTFLFFDDFNGSSLDTSKWDTDGDSGYNAASYSLSNGVLSVWSTSGWRLLKSQFGILPNDQIVLDVKVSETANSNWHTHYIVQNNSANTNRFGIQRDGSTGLRMQTYVSGASSLPKTLGLMTYNQYYILRINKKNSTLFNATLYNSERTFINDYQVSQNAWSSVTWAWLMWKDSSTLSYYDWILVRSYSEVEPSYTIGDEQRITSTDSNGEYNYTFTVNKTQGSYLIEINSSYLGESIEENQTIVIGATAPAFSNLIYSPNLSGQIDPGVNITFNASISAIGVNIDTAILQIYNGSVWSNNSMYNLSSSLYQTNITLSESNLNYTYSIWANNTVGMASESQNYTFESKWDCTWSISPTNLGATAGFSEVKKIGDINVSNTGDIQFENNNCSLSLRVTYDLPQGRIYYNGTTFKNSRTYTLSTGQNMSLELNASFGTEEKEEIAIITINDKTNTVGISEDASQDVSATLVSTTGGPYLYQDITSNPSSVNLIEGNFSLQGYIKNLAGDGTDANTAFNISFNWSFPSTFNVLEGSSNVSYENISNSSLHYNNLIIGFDSSNLANLPSGIVPIRLYASGFNSSGDQIVHANNVTLLSKEVNITLVCNNVSDGIYVASCGSLDGDYVAPVSSSPSSSSSSGGGGGSGGGQVVKFVSNSVDLQLVRGKEGSINFPFKNDDINNSLINLNFSVSGEISKYVQLIPESLDDLGPGEEFNLTLLITSPSYIELGKQELLVEIVGRLSNGRNYKENKVLVLEIHEINTQEAERLVLEAEELVQRLREVNLSYDILEGKLKEIKIMFEKFEYEKVIENHNYIKTNVENALESLEIINSLEILISDAIEKQIDVSSSDRILRLAKLSLERRDFTGALSRAKEAQVTYALEVKGEFGSVGYYVREYPKEILFSTLFLLLFSFTGYKVTRIQLLKKKIRKLREEERILGELMRVVQIDTFQKKNMSMEEYQQAMKYYESKLSKVIEQIIQNENIRAHEIKFIGAQKRLNIERQRILDLIKEIQRDYLQRKKMETRSYELRLKSYNRRLSEIDQSLANLEAKGALSRNKNIFNKMSFGLIGGSSK